MGNLGRWAADAATDVFRTAFLRCWALTLVVNSRAAIISSVNVEYDFFIL
jgi:hypothetical protein